jgi:hypothetical protein
MLDFVKCSGNSDAWTKMKPDDRSWLRGEPPCEGDSAPYLKKVALLAVGGLQTESHNRPSRDTKLDAHNHASYFQSETPFNGSQLESTEYFDLLPRLRHP